MPAVFRSLRAVRRLWCGAGLCALLIGPPTPATAQPGPEARQLRRLNERAEYSFGTNPQQALRLARQAEALAHRVGNQTEEAWAVTNIGSAWYLIGDYQQALDAYRRALPLHEAAGNQQGLGACLNNLGNLHYTHQQYKPALEYYCRSLRIDEQRGDSAGAATGYINMAAVLTDTHQPDSALAYCERALRIARAVGARDAEASALSHMGVLYADLHLFQQAQPYLEDALQLYRQQGNQSGQATALRGLGDVQRGLGHWQEAISDYQESLRIGAEFSDVVRDTYEHLAEAQALAGDYKGALTSARQHKELNDSLFNRETADQMAELETRFRTREQRREIEVQQLTITRKTYLLFFISTTTVLVLAGAGGLWVQYRQKRETNRRLSAANADIQQAMAEKEMLLQEIHHRVKNNLQLVSSLLSWQTDDPHTPPEVVRVIGESRARIQAMALIHEHLYRADDLAQVRLDAYLTQLLTSLHSAHSSGLLRVELVTELAEIIISPKEAIPFGLLLNEVVTNAYKHAWPGRTSGTLFVTLTTPAAPPAVPLATAPVPATTAAAAPANPKGADFVLRLCDDGVGVKPEALGPDGLPLRAGSLGVQLVKMLTRQLKARLTVSARPEGGTCFEIRRG